ncbi:hypothetical protein V2G26_012773 [Clonostachys chloroleuca]
MSVSVKFVDWSQDVFRYNEERKRVTNMIQRIAAEKGHTHGVVQKLWNKQRALATSRPGFTSQRIVFYRTLKAIQNGIPRSMRLPNPMCCQGTGKMIAVL